MILLIIKCLTPLRLKKEIKEEQPAFDMNELFKKLNNDKDVKEYLRLLQNVNAN